MSDHNLDVNKLTLIEWISPAPRLDMRASEGLFPLSMSRIYSAELEHPGVGALTGDWIIPLSLARSF